MNNREQLQRENYNSVMYKCVIDFLQQEHSLKELRDARKSLLTNSKLYDDVRGQLIIFVDAFISKNEKAARAALIRPFTAWEPLIFNLKGLEDVEKKIERIRSPKLKYAFSGVFNLLNERGNLIYNKLGTRQTLINDLNKFKSFNFFKVAYVSAFDLKKDFRHLSVKGNTKQFRTQIIPIEHGLFVLKTLETDGISLKAFYIQEKVNNLLEKGGRAANLKKAVPRGDKFNLSSVDAWKTLEKEDNIRFYGYCNRAGLDKKNRELLKAIRRKQGGQTFSCYLESVEDRKNELEAKYDELAKITCENGVVITNYEYLDELEAVTRRYWELTEEHNSDDVPTELGDYEW